MQDVTSKYTLRDKGMYEEFGKRIVECLDAAVERNAIVFFPSYSFLDNVLSKLNLVGLGRKIFKEQKQMTKDEKERYVSEFKQQTRGGGKVLFAVVGGSFAEGLDLPGKALEILIVIGLPLGVPDITTTAVINHF